MKLRYYVEVSPHGVKTDPVLQYWSTIFDMWQNIPTVEIKSNQAGGSLSAIGEIYEYAEDEIP